MNTEDRMTVAFKRGWVLVLATIHLLTGLAMMISTPMWFRDSEELHNATVARELLIGHGRHLLEYQYMDFCGGCTGVALAGWAAFAAAGANFLAWKLVPLGIGFAIVVTGSALLGRAVSSAAGMAFALLMAGASTLLGQTMMMAWGNHYEVMLLVLCQGLAVAHLVHAPERRWLWGAWGLCAGLTSWFCYTALYAFPFLALVVALSIPVRTAVRRLPLLLSCLIIGLSPLALYRIKTGIDPLEVIWLNRTGPWLEPGKLWEASLGAYAGWMQLTPWRLLPGGWVTLAGLWGGAAAALAGWRRAAIPLALLVGGATQYFIAPIRAPGCAPQAVPMPLTLRYLMPEQLGWPLVAAAGIGLLWERGRYGRLIAGFLTALVMIPGLSARVRWIAGPDDDWYKPRLADIAAYNYDIFNGNGFKRVNRPDLLRWSPADRVSYVNSRRALGLEYAERVLKGSPEEAVTVLEKFRKIRAESPLMLHGLGLELNALHRYGHIALEDYLPQVQAMLLAADPTERRALAVGIWSGDRDLADWPDLKAADCALCPAKGLQLGRVRPLTEIHAAGDVVRGGEEALNADPSMRLPILEGAGAAMGHSLGYLPREVGDAVAGFAEADRVAYLRGFAIGRTSVWATEPDPRAPPERVPQAYPP